MSAGQNAEIAQQGCNTDKEVLWFLTAVAEQACNSLNTDCAAAAVGLAVWQGHAVTYIPGSPSGPAVLLAGLTAWPPEESCRGSHHAGLAPSPSQTSAASDE